MNNPLIRRRILLAAAMVCLLGIGVAGGAVLERFLAPDAINVTQLIPDPPTRNSEEQQAEIVEMLQLQTTRTDEEKARILMEDNLNVFAFSDVLGPWFNAKNCPNAAQFFDSVTAHAAGFADIGKKHWNQPRPFVDDARITPYGAAPKSPTYPSGHSTEATVDSQILAAMFPDQRDALLERGRQIGWDRVIAGVHYPSDIAAGRVLGQDVAEKLLASRHFQSEMADVKAELDQARQAATTEK